MSITVTTDAGAVRGVESAEARVFLNVPYAAPPVGAGRFDAPQPHVPWSGVRDARTPGPTAPQPFRGRLGDLDLSPFFGDGWVRGDDYLTVNVWAPRTVAEPAPVMVFVHGGAFIAGSTHGPVYDGTAFARDGVVFVTVNYRLGIPGFLHLPDAVDNRGLLDVVAALRWVRQNIASFGGDPGNVTLMGQSAGAIIVGGLLADATANDLFARAIVQSGSGTGTFTPDQAAVVTTRVGELLGVESTAAALSDIDDERFVGVLPEVAGTDLATATDVAPLGGITVFGLVLSEQPVAAVDAAGTLPDLLIGDNADEATLYVAPQGQLDAVTENDLLADASRFSSDPAALVARHRAELPGASAADLRVAILSEGMFGRGTALLATAHSGRPDSSTYVYRFAWASDAVDSRLRSSHLMELPFVFDRLDLAELSGTTALLGSTPAPSDLATWMHESWVRFATTGSPGWDRYTPQGRVVQVLGGTR